jgi:hypothetical protein
MNADEVHLLASEVKTTSAFGFRKMWYHGPRGIQILSALYGFNCPTFLLTQKQWKLFVENKERNAIFTFPYDDSSNIAHVNSSLVGQMGTTFLKAIVICLLSRRAHLDEIQKEVTHESIAAIETPEKQIISSKLFDTITKPRRKSARLQEAEKKKSASVAPTFISGYDNGQPIYSPVRIVPLEVVAQIEKDMDLQKKGYQEQISQITLVE